MKKLYCTSLYFLVLFFLSCTGKDALEFNNYVVQNQGVILIQFHKISELQKDSITLSNYKILIAESKKLAELSDSCKNEIQKKSAFKDEVFYRETIQLFEHYKQIAFSKEQFYKNIETFLGKKTLNDEEKNQVIAFSIQLQKAMLKLDSLQKNHTIIQQKFAEENYFKIK